MKTAICFSGHLRDYEQAKNYWKEFIDLNKCEVFASIWDSCNDSSEKFQTEFNPKKFESEDQSILNADLEFLRKNISLPHLSNGRALNKELTDAFISMKTFSMWYKIWRANLLSQNESFDVVIRARFDAFFKKPFLVEQNSYINVPNFKVYVRNWPNCVGPVDLFAYGSQKLISYYSSLFYKYYSYFEKQHTVSIAENLLRIHLAEKDIEIRNIPHQFTLRDGIWTISNDCFYTEKTSEWYHEPILEYGFFKKNKGL